MDIANVTLCGRLVKDPLFFGEDTKRRAVFTVAVNRGSADRKRTTYVDCIAWGKRADIVEGSSKGNSVVILGQLEMDKYTRKDDQGNEVTQVKMQINVDSFIAGNLQDGGPRARQQEPAGSRSSGGADEELDLPF